MAPLTSEADVSGGQALGHVRKGQLGRSTARAVLVGRLTERGARRLGERERSLGVDADDEAARWLAEHDPVPEPEPSKSAFKSKELHRWRQKRGGRPSS